MRYRPIEQKEEDDETSDDLQNAILDAVDELYRDLRGDILIFLSGEREIRETTDSLKKHHPTQYESCRCIQSSVSVNRSASSSPKGEKYASSWQPMSRKHL